LVRVAEIYEEAARLNEPPALAKAGSAPQALSGRMTNVESTF
jgi:hypothetical protein